MTFSVGNSGYRRSSNLDKVIYILERLGQDSNTASPEQMARELYVEENVVRSFIKFLKDMQWIKEKDHNLYIITEKGDLWLNSTKEAIEG